MVINGGYKDNITDNMAYYPYISTIDFIGYTLEPLMYSSSSSSSNNSSNDCNTSTQASSSNFSSSSNDCGASKPH